MDTKGNRLRNPTRFGSWKSGKSGSDDPDDEPLSAVSSKAPSVNWGEFGDLGLRSRNVLLHGEVQTSSTLFRRKKEYLVLTETHVVRFKTQQKASETFSEIWSPLNRSASSKHQSRPSVGSIQDFQSCASENSGERNVGTPLRQVIAIYQLVDDRPYFAFEITYMDEESNHPYAMTLQFGSPEDMTKWLTAIKAAANRVRSLDENTISENNTRLAARIVEREGDYDPRNFALYKVVQRPSHKPGLASSSSDDLTKISNSVCFLAVGIHKIHLIPIFKSRQRSSSPNLMMYPSEASFGILTLTSVRLSEIDDTFELVFRTPLQKPKVLLMASLAAGDIAVRLHHVEHFLRPEWEPRPYVFLVPNAVKEEIVSTTITDKIDENSLVRTLCAYCIAYNIPPERIRYTITYPEDDFPCFQLLPPEGRRRSGYGALELLAVMRTLRYNESFGTISFAGISLDVLNELHDRYGSDHLCTKTKRGTPINLSMEELSKSCLLVQEIRALAVTSRRLRRMNFSKCITREPADFVDENKGKDVGCGIVEALFPLCKYQTTNVDWIILNEITLGETDLEYLIAAAAERHCHLRALELSKCGLNERKMSLLLDALRTQENTLEAIDISKNTARLVPSIFDPQLSVFGYIRILNLCGVGHTAGPEPLLTAETLLSWRLQELNLSGTQLNHATIEAIATYLKSPKSDSLHKLRVDRTCITGRQIAHLMRSMTRYPGMARELHMDISENYIEKFHFEFAAAISDGYAPMHLTIELIDYDDESHFAELALAIAKNNTIRRLDVTKVSLPSDASEGTCDALEKMFKDNKTLIALDMSGEDSKLETAKFGVGINKALCGLKYNNTLRELHIKNQGLGLQGASTLADVLKDNTSLISLHCENNNIPLQGFTDLVNALHNNTTIQWLPSMDDSRYENLRQTEMAIRNMRGETLSNTPAKHTSVRSKLANKIGGKASVEKPAVIPISDQDARAAVSLVEESWERQAHRLNIYLQRNVNIAAGIPTPIDIEEELPERPDRPFSMGKLIEQVQIDSTPTIEKQAILGALDFEDDHVDDRSQLDQHSQHFVAQQISESDPFVDMDPMVVSLAKELDVSLGDAQTLLDLNAAPRLMRQISPHSPTSPKSPRTPREIKPREAIPHR
ncbi:uncharacterized protein K452DRAFT_225981 [Aplosporella prunicola CBS 121167]|uniref:PH domain-containing protein n=1 Tax=Aplosporella prunicola CBS 121167 TaxID=1176127 RepID=A0A6A6BHA6_9PEZI|nr:uncharacterized protein K452DRAFT_225981 [Aplosporella prunicola CBS 121167]KAF2142978.1 hypothetical protein K452DRAFT_225981 [Aplosporella prunicola CBS 121167]